MSMFLNNIFLLDLKFKTQAFQHISYFKDYPFTDEQYEINIIFIATRDSLGSNP